MIDLYKNIYNRQTLKDNIYNVKLIDILKTQKIDVFFAVRYILNRKYQLHEDDNITSDIVLKYQPHITYEQLQESLLNYESDDDSVDNFETVCDKK
jgi:hypothetical protein